MTTFNKIVIGLLVVAFAAIGVLGYTVYHKSASVAGYYPTNYSSLYVTPSVANGDTYVMAFGTSPYSTPVSTLIDINGNWVGNYALAGTGFSGPYSTSTTFTASAFAAAKNQQWLGTSAVATATTPAATSSYIAFNSPALGELFPFQVTNDSTNTVNYVAGTGVVFKLETQGVGTSTVSGGGTASQISILASSTVQGWTYWDSASSTQIITWGNNFK